MIQLTTKSLFVLFALVLTVQTALALPEDKDKPIRILSDSVELDDLKGVSVYKGNVKYQQGTIELLADKVIVHTNDDGIAEIQAFGNPASYQEVHDKDKPPIKASAKTITYDAANEQIVLVENAIIEQKEDYFAAPHITYHLTKKTIASKGGRTEILMHPQNHQGSKRMIP